MASTSEEVTEIERKQALATHLGVDVESVNIGSRGQYSPPGRTGLLWVRTETEDCDYLAKTPPNVQQAIVAKVPLASGHVFVIRSEHAARRSACNGDHSTTLPFNTRKTIEAAADLIQKQPCRCENSMRLAKLLYLGDRLSLKQRGVPICGGTVYAVRRGPVIGRVLDLVKGIDADSALWNQFFERVDFNVRLRADPGKLSLSRADLKILDQVANDFRDYDEWSLVRWCHKNLPEYAKSRSARDRKHRGRIPLGDILEAVGRQDGAAIVSALNESTAFDAFFGNHLPT